MPSSGSTTQLRPLLARLLAALLLAEKPSSGPPRREQLADRPLGGEVGLADEVRRRALAGDVGARRRGAARSASRPPPSRAASTARPSSSCSDAHEKPAGAVGPRALGLELGGERQQRGLVARAAHELHRPRQAVGREAGRHRGGRLAGEVPDAVVGDPAGDRVERPQRAAPLQRADRGGGIAAVGRGDQHVVVRRRAGSAAPSEPASAANERSQQRPGRSGRRAAPSRACAVRGARGARAPRRRRGCRAGSARSRPGSCRCRSRGRARPPRGRASAAARRSPRSARARRPSSFASTTGREASSSRRSAAARRRRRRPRRSATFGRGRGGRRRPRSCPRRRRGTAPCRRRGASARR